ncbi:hypothetical protein J6590_041233 [Homalodisca vitripennis]|nr:hypothetical protein J6590_041233 [Homalodisca vitripennis]
MLIQAASLDTRKCMLDERVNLWSALIRWESEFQLESRNHVLSESRRGLDHAFTIIPEWFTSSRPSLYDWAAPAFVTRMRVPLERVPNLVVCCAAQCFKAPRRPTFQDFDEGVDEVGLVEEEGIERFTRT